MADVRLLACSKLLLKTEARGRSVLFGLFDTLNLVAVAKWINGFQGVFRVSNLKIRPIYNMDD